MILLVPPTRAFFLANIRRLTEVVILKRFRPASKAGSSMLLA
jgi:hypothetical protein